ncbi:MAG TPA: alkaline phosphatase family protein [Candidatus Binataceae bacterium]|nr:alkaline phosphatase family protein [Candidatus Binataceae bacterium]
MRIRMLRHRSLLPTLALIVMLLVASFARGAGRGRIVILMVWDGLRPDLVTARNTPNLFRMSHEGVRFDHHHSIYPTLTMANAGALATGAMPGRDGLVGNVMMLAPSLMHAGASLDDPILAGWIEKPVVLESSEKLAALNGPHGFAGHLVELDTVAQEIEREGGYIAIIGKQGPTFIFDNRVSGVIDGHDIVHEAHHDYLFLSDDMAAPSDAQDLLRAEPEANKTGVVDSLRDAYFAKVTVERAIPAAKRAAEAGRPAMILLWQHNPDLTQHLAGLGTQPALDALTESDHNLSRVREAVSAADIADKTDIIVVSDHGFATVRLSVNVSAALARAAIKKSPDSDDVVVARNGGSDLIYLSPTAFGSAESRRNEMQKIVEFAEAQEWCGPIFSRGVARTAPAKSISDTYAGAIEGTFDMAAIGILNPERTPDLVLSFREIADGDNRGLTGPENAAFAIGADGQVSGPNKSKPLVQPIPGLVYADVDGFTTGMGMHGAAGVREIHNFCTAFGPDFRRSWIDHNPTANTDVAPTITRILGLLPNIGPGGVLPTGRAMTEAMVGERTSVGQPRAIAPMVRLTLQGVEVDTTLKITRLGDRDYLDDSFVDRIPLGSSP